MMSAVILQKPLYSGFEGCSETLMHFLTFTPATNSGVTLLKVNIKTVIGRDLLYLFYVLLEWLVTVPRELNQACGNWYVCVCKVELGYNVMKGTEYFVPYNPGV